MVQEVDSASLEEYQDIRNEQFPFQDLVDPRNWLKFVFGNDDESKDSQQNLDTGDHQMTENIRAVQWQEGDTQVSLAASSKPTEVIVDGPFPSTSRDLVEGEETPRRASRCSKLTALLFSPICILLLFLILNYPWLKEYFQLPDIQLPSHWTLPRVADFRLGKSLPSFEMTTTESHVQSAKSTKKVLEEGQQGGKTKVANPRPTTVDVWPKWCEDKSDPRCREYADAIPKCNEKSSLQRLLDGNCRLHQRLVRERQRLERRQERRITKKTIKERRAKRPSPPSTYSNATLTTGGDPFQEHPCTNMFSRECRLHKKRELAEQMHVPPTSSGRVVLSKPNMHAASVTTRDTTDTETTNTTSKLEMPGAWFKLLYVLFALVVVYIMFQLGTDY